MIEAEACSDHIHMLVCIPPHISVSQFMGYLKGKSSLMIFAALKLIEQLYYDGHISQKMFRDILFEHSDVVDIAQFNLQRPNK